MDCVDCPASRVKSAILESQALLDWTVNQATRA